MQTMRANTPGISGLDSIAGIIGAVIGALVVAVVMLLVYFARYVFWPALRYAYKRWGHRLLPQRATAMPVIAKAVAGDGSNPATDAHQIDSPQVATRIKGFDVGQGQALIHLRINDVRSTARRLVTFKEEACVARYGRRHDLGEVPIPPDGGVAQIAKVTIATVEAMLGRVDQDGESAQEVVHSDLEPPPLEQDFGPPVEACEPFPEEYGDTPPDVPQPAAAPAAPSKRQRRPRKGIVSYEGTLLRAGIESRNDVPKPYDCFCVTLEDHALGCEQQIWGTDLKRALEEAGVANGQAVKVKLIGETPVFVKGRSSMKKIWAVENAA